MKITTILLLFLATACGNHGSSANPEVELLDSFEDLGDIPSQNDGKNVPKEALESSEQKTETKRDFEKKLIKKGGLFYQVVETTKEYEKIQSLLQQYKGYISSENETKDYDRINYRMTVKIPPENFETFISSISKGKKIEKNG